jgi:isochorismate synthase EntC
VRATPARPATTGLLDVAGHLHPTPAVCGAPRAEACRRLALEEPDRGWYGGAIGWVDARGDGELAVALRATLLDGDAHEATLDPDAAQTARGSDEAADRQPPNATAHVWAGAGIVDGSSPEREFEETERKMRSILPFLEAPRDECAA